jgi:hypothetical protein
MLRDALHRPLVRTYVPGLAVLILIAASPADAQSGVFEQDSTLDNLSHPSGYLTAYRTHGVEQLLGDAFRSRVAQQQRCVLPCQMTGIEGELVGANLPQCIRRE